MKLYELVIAHQEILDLNLDEADLQTALQSLQGTVEENAEGLCNVMNQLNANQAAYKAEIDRLKAKIDRDKKKYDGIKQYLSDSLLAMNITKLKAGLNDISFRKSESTVIDDETKVSKQFKSEVVTVKVDKTAIKKAIKAGEIVEGAHIEVKQNIQIR